MLELLKSKIKNLPVDYGEIHFEEVNTTVVSYSNDNIEAISQATTSSGNTRMLYNSGWGFASFNDTDFDKYTNLAIENAKLIGKDKSTIKLFDKPIIDEITTEFEIDPSTMTLKDKNEICLKYNQILKHPKIVNTQVFYRDRTITKYFVNTEGSAIKQTKTHTGIRFGAMAKDGTNIQRAFDSSGQHGGLELALGFEENAEAVKKRAIDLLSAKQIHGGQYKVLLNPMLAGVFAHEAFGHLSEADFLHENPRFQEVMVLGRQFGTEKLNIIDDGTLKGLGGYVPYDDEGVPANKTYLIKNGKLVGRLHSRETAGKMSETTTGNARSQSPLFQPIVRMTNTYIDNGDTNFDDLLASLDDGIYACDFLGGMTNLEMFTFSSGYAYRVKNGKIVELLRDVVLTGNVFETLHNIVAFGNDLEHYGGLGACGKGGQAVSVSTGSPSIMIKNVLVGGV